MDAAIIKKYQSYLKKNPLNVNYLGAEDGDLNSPGFQESLIDLETIIKTKYQQNKQQDKANTFKIINNDQIVLPLQELQTIVNSLSMQSTSLLAPQQPNIVQQIQELFNSNPFGIVYNGLCDGILSSEFIKKLQELELNIQNVSGAQIIGKIVLNNQITTTPDELSKTFQLIKAYQDFLKTSKK